MVPWSPFSNLDDYPHFGMLSSESLDNAINGFQNELQKEHNHKEISKEQAKYYKSLFKFYKLAHPDWIDSSFEGQEIYYIIDKLKKHEAENTN